MCTAIPVFGPWRSKPRWPTRPLPPCGASGFSRFAARIEKSCLSPSSEQELLSLQANLPLELVPKLRGRRPRASLSSLVELSGRYHFASLALPATPGLALLLISSFLGESISSTPEGEGVRRTRPVASKN